MKPLKAENEVRGTMKGTAKYAFLPPGVIGKGRGRGQGLRSMCSLGVSGDKVGSFHQSAGLGMPLAKKKLPVLEQKHMQTDTPIPQSSDLVMEYIQTVESGCIGKGLGRGISQSITTSPDSTRFKSIKSVGQGMRITHKNSLAFEKEHTPVHHSTDPVMQYSQASDTSASSHQSVPSACQGMRTTNKIPKVLEKEHLQTDIPVHPSTDQAKESTQAVETSSCPTGKAKRVRGRNKLKEVATLEVGQKLNISFYQNRTVGDNNNSFSRHLGKIVRDTNMCPLAVSSWKDIKEEKLNHMWAAVEITIDKFESDDLDIHRDHIMKWMRELWNKFRGELYAKYVKGKPIQEALRHVPKGVDKKQWEWLVKEHFSKESFKARSRRNAANRGKLKMLHHIGSKPIREISYQKGGKDGNPPDLATIFFETRKKNETLVDPEAIEKHAQIQELVNSEPSLSTIEIVEKCFGPQSRSHVVGFGGGVKAKDLKGGTSSKTELLFELRATQKENQCLKDRLSTVENQVKELAPLKEILLAQFPNGWPSTTPIPEE